MIIKKYFAIFAFLCVLCVKNYAQTLNLEQARLLALANSRSLAKHELAIRSSVLDSQSQFFSMLPQVSAGYSAQADYLRNWEFIDPAKTFSAGANLSITQIIFQGGKSFIQKALSSIALESARNDALAEYFNVLDSVDNAYYAALEAKAVLEAEEASLESARLGYSIAEVRHSAGMITAGDYLKALADRESRENSHNQARRNLALCETKLRALTGISGAFEIEEIDLSAYEDALIFLSGITDEDAALLYSAFWALLLESNPSMARADFSKQRAEHNYALVLRDLAPTVSATVFAMGLNYSAANGFTDSASGGISIRGSIPLDFWVFSNKMEKSAIARENSLIDYQNTYSSLEMELQSALLSVYSAAGSCLSSRRSLDYTERNYNFVMERYRLSQSSVSELNDAASLFISSRNSHIRATYSFLQSVSRLRALCACDDEEKLLQMLQRNFF